MEAPPPNAYIFGRGIVRFIEAKRAKMQNWAFHLDETQFLHKAEFCVSPRPNAQFGAWCPFPP